MAFAAYCALIVKIFAVDSEVQIFVLVTPSFREPLDQETLKSFGLSSFGFGGTNTHVSGRAADTEAVATAPAQEMLKGPTLCISWSFRWQKVDNRLNHAASLSPEMKSLGTWRLCPSPSPEEKIVFNRQRFGWSQTKHPLSVQPRRGADDDLAAHFLQGSKLS